MSQQLELTAIARNNSGTGSARAVRREGNIPAILYGGDIKENKNLAVSAREFNKEYFKGGIKTRPILLQIGNESITALVHAVQVHPVSDQPLHIDFLQVNKDTQIKVKVALSVINEDKSPGVKKGGVVNLVMHYVDVLCNPFNIPHHIELDVGNLEIGQNIHVNDIHLPSGVTPFDKTNPTILSITGRHEEVAATPEA